MTTETKLKKWTLDPVHSYIEFTIWMNNENPRKLFFKKVAAALQMEDKFEDSKFVIQWAVDSVDSGDKAFDKFVHSEDFLNVNKIPIIKFTSEKVSKLSETQFGVRGLLTYGKWEEPISFNAKFEGKIVHSSNGLERTGFYLSTQAEPHIFHLQERTVKFDKSIGIEIDLEFVR